ncbi:DUF4157 domain-containing protein [Moorena producens]|uniref:eCIS core domain-containing protein n=1 Tax=Moorena producens TaxID=1155739 RepID=UPI003C739DF5
MGSRRRLDAEDREWNAEEAVGEWGSRMANVMHSLETGQYVPDTGWYEMGLQAKLSFGQPVEKNQEGANRGGYQVVQPKRIMVQRSAQPLAGDSETGGDGYNASRKEKENKTGMPDGLKAGIENLSGYSMDDVRVHYNSEKPAQLQAHAYAKGTEIHVGPGQEKHLPHEAWHVVQQKEGRVKRPRVKQDGVMVNHDKGLEMEADMMGAQALANAAQLQGASEEQERFPGKFTSLCCTSPRKAHRAVPAEVAQLAGERAKNPHNLQTGVTSHHIIPHELLMKILKNFTTDQQKIKGAFLPKFDSLTLANFVAQVAVGVKYDQKNYDSVTELPKEVATKPFGLLTPTQKSKTMFKVEYADWIDFTKFEEIYKKYEKVIRGEEVLNEQENPVTGLRDLGDSFFEWQGGNLFYGPERIEPGSKDGFDYDAKLIYGEKYTKDLEAIYKQLKKLQNNSDQDSLNQMLDLLRSMAELTKNQGVPPYNDQLWIAIDTDAKKSVHDELLPERGKTSKKGLSIHRQVLNEAISAYSKSSNRAHLLLRPEKYTQTQLDAEKVFGVDNNQMWLKASPLKQHTRKRVPQWQKLQTVQEAMCFILWEFFGI